MGTVPGSNARVLFGSNDVSAYFNEASYARRKDLVDTTTFGDSARRYLEILRHGSATLTGFYDGDATKLSAQLSTAFQAAATTVLTLAPNSTTVGNEAWLLAAHTPRYDVKQVTSGVVGTSAQFDADGPIDVGRWLHALAAETGGGDSASVDNGATTSNGGVANLHVTAFAGTSVTVKVQHSADNSSFADLIAFTAVAGATSQQLAVSGTVDRYVRESRSGIFSSCTFAVAFARR